MIGFLPVFWWALGISMVVGGGIYLFMEYQAYLLRTDVSGTPGGLRFTSKGFVVEARYAQKQVLVQTKNGKYKRQPLPSGDEVLQTEALDVTLPAAGLQAQVFNVVVTDPDDQTQKGTGFCNIVFNASDDLIMRAQGKAGTERMELRIEGVPAKIAGDFQRFVNSLHVWLGKVERGLLSEVEARRLQQEAEAKAIADAASPKEDLSVPLTDEERKARADAQIATWREAAGFKGTSSESSINPRGQIEWYIEVDQTGRVILHATKRTMHGSLLGAKVTSLTGELEISVRDEYWTEDEPELTVFRVLTGAPPEVRQAWKERLEILIQSLNRTAMQGR